MAMHWNGFRQRLKKDLLRLREGLNQEKDQTRQMVEIYLRQASGEKISKNELKEAHQQLRDVIKGMGLGVLLVLPFAPITLPLLIKLGRIVGVEVLPDSFREAASPPE